jgi:hypothetical protein
MRFGVPLSVPGPRYVERCYGKHGKGYARTPPRYSAIELVLINEERQLWAVPGCHQETHEYVTSMVGVDGWRILGWRMADGSMPLGEYDEVDPELAQIDYLPMPNNVPLPNPSVMCHPCETHACPKAPPASCLTSSPSEFPSAPRIGVLACSSS